MTAAQPRQHSGLLRELVLTALITVVSFLAAPQSDVPSCHRAPDPASLLTHEGIWLDPQPRVCVHKTPQELLVHIVKGNTLLNPPKTASHHVIVIAGRARISDADAVVCASVDGDRTFVTVLGGTARLATLDLCDNSHITNELTLRAGDRAAILHKGAELIFRLEAGDTNPATPPGTSVPSSTRPIRQSQRNPPQTDTPPHWAAARSREPARSTSRQGCLHLIGRRSTGRACAQALRPRLTIGR
jgi:hypothetical protein